MTFTLYARLGTFKKAPFRVCDFTKQEKIPQQTQTFVQIMPSSNPSTTDSWQFNTFKKTICDGLIAASSRDTYDIQLFASNSYMGDELSDETTLVDDGPALKALVSAHDKLT
jgi:hypothetical protein